MKLFTVQEKTKLVLDSNIVVSALIAKQGYSAKVFEKLILGEIENFTSKEIIEELEQVFKQKKIIKRTTQEARTFVLAQFIGNSIIVVEKEKIEICEDKADNKFIEVAVEAKAQFLISGDNHLLKIKTYKHTQIITAKELLSTKPF